MRFLSEEAVFMLRPKERKEARSVMTLKVRGLKLKVLRQD